MAKLWCSLLLVALVFIAVSCGQSAARGQAPLNGAAIQMVDAQNGWAYSQHLIARTSDGAQTFKAVTPPNLPAGAQLDPPLLLDSQQAFVFAIVWNGSTLASSVLERTSDGGVTWQATSMTPAVQGDLTFFDSRHGWLVTGQSSADRLTMTDTLRRTTDGGATWTSIYSYAYRVDVHPSTQPGGCYWQGSIAWSSIDNGVVGVACPFDVAPAIDVTDDGGLTWTRRRLPPVGGPAGIVLYSITGPVHLFPGGEALTLVSRCVGSDGMSCTPYAQLYRSADGGVTWSGGETFRGGVWGLLSADWKHSWMSGGCLGDCTSFGLLATADGGATWQVFPLRPELQTNMHGSRVYSFVTAELGFATADNEFQKTSGYFKTTTGGQTFESIQPKLET